MLTDSSEITVKSIISPAAYERVRGYLQHTIPGGAVGSATFGAVEDALVDRFVILLWQEHPEAARKLGLVDPPADFLDSLPVDSFAMRRKLEHSFSAGGGENEATDLPRYYIVNSRHHRHGGSDFVGTVPMVRISLPNDGDSYRIGTVIGDVLASDHLLRNRQDLVAKAYPCERAELITPVRRDGVRFAAISVILAYEKFGDTLPKYYVLEAGLAQGGARMSYIAPSMATIVRRSDYQPTQFASPSNFYRGDMAMNDNEPSVLTIESFTSDPRKDSSATPYITISASFVHVSRFDKRLDTAPLQLYREAVIRVAAIAESLGQRVADLSILQGIFAQDGRSLDWLTAPQPAGKSR
jgi:hypothetical protein